MSTWAQIEMRFAYDEEGKGKNPFWIDKMTPIQIAAFDLEEYQRQRAEFTSDEWMDLILRSMGYEPSEMPRRLQRGWIDYKRAAALQLLKAIFVTTVVLVVLAVIAGNFPKIGVIAALCSLLSRYTLVSNRSRRFRLKTSLPR